jgi:hypothetical protein
VGYKRLTGIFPVSVDSAQLEIACYQWTNSCFVSADSEGVKVLCLEQIASADSKGDRRSREAVRIRLAGLRTKTHDLGYHDLLMMSINNCMVLIRIDSARQRASDWYLLQIEYGR